MAIVRIAIVGLAYAGSAGIAYGDPTQWAGNGHWYDAVLVGPQGISWTDAQSAATTRGGYLATITSSDENDFVYSLVTSDAFWFTDAQFGNGIGPWLGGYQTDKLAEPDGHWAWVTGEPWGGYTNWAVSSNPFSAEPNDSMGTEDYLQFLGLRQPQGSLWNDYPNNSQPADEGFVRGYIIEFNFSPVPEPTSLGLLALGMMAIFMSRRRSAA